jgi:hypothetical protein
MNTRDLSTPLPASANRGPDPGEFDAHWMPFSGNREFKANPRLITAAAGAYYSTRDGRRLFDGLSGLRWRSRSRGACRLGWTACSSPALAPKLPTPR